MSANLTFILLCLAVVVTDILVTRLTFIKTNILAMEASAFKRIRILRALDTSLRLVAITAVAHHIAGAQTASIVATILFIHALFVQQHLNFLQAKARLLNELVELLA